MHDVRPIKKFIEKQEKSFDIEDAIKDLMRQNEVLHNKQLYLEDFIQKKEHDLGQKKAELTAALKKIQDLNKTIDDMKGIHSISWHPAERFIGHRKSTGSLQGRNDPSASFRSERKQRYDRFGPHRRIA